MKKILCILLIINFSARAQTIPNGNFESWNSVTFEEPNGWMTANSESAMKYLTPTISKVTGVTGYAAKMETKKVGGDLVEAWMTVGNGDPMQGIGGFPCNQKPTSITGKHMSNIVGKDTNLVLVVFKKGGVVIADFLFPITTTVSTFTNFSFPISLSQTPDTAIIAIAASNIIEYNGVEIGTWFIVDDLALGGTTVTIPNGNFENWTTSNMNEIQKWTTYGREGRSIKKSNEPYRGTYAIQLETYKDNDGYVGQSGIRLSQQDKQGNLISHGVPYTLMNDTLFGYYKYFPNGQDTAEVFACLYKNGNSLGWFGNRLSATSTYTRFEIIFGVGITPDSIDVFASSSTYDNKKEGSTLILDEIQLASSKLNTTGLKSLTNPLLNKVVLFPNPVTERLFLRFPSDFSPTGVEVSVIDIQGRQLMTTRNTEDIVNGIDLTTLGSGIYQCLIQSADGRSTSLRFIRN